MASVLMQESSAQDNQVKEHPSRYVNYKGITSKAVAVLLIIWTVFQVYFTTFGAISAINLRAFHCLFLLLFTFLLFPVTRKSLKQRRYPSLLNLLLIALSIFCILYLVIYFPRVARSGGRLNTTDLYVAGIGILLVFEASRRAC